MDVSIIGAGLGGLAASCLLASEGHTVTVFEKNEEPGGKISQREANGFRFDTGPSLLTMPFILEELFSKCGTDIDDFLTIKQVNPMCRYFYPDGIRFNCYQQRENTLEEIRKFASDDLVNYGDFLDYSSQLYHKTKDAFLYNPLYGFRDLRSLNLLDFFRIDAFTTVSDRVNDYFTSPYLRQFFKRFTTYNGSSPFQAPATLNVIPHVELTLGGFYVDGGIYTIIKALNRLAKSIGVKFYYGSEVKSICVDDGQATGIRLKGDITLSSDLVISNSDASETYTRLLNQDNVSQRNRDGIQNLEPSCSGFVLLLGTDRTYDRLSHHNIFFSTDYKNEFRQIFRDKVMPDDPTIYIANSSHSNPDHAPPGGSNLFVLVNAPCLSDRWDWSSNKEQYARFIIKELENRGLEGLNDSIQFREIITPVDFLHKYRSNKGSIYGTSSNNRLAAFLRPGNKCRQIDGLYLVGGSTHPGGGIPLVILSAFHATELIKRYENLK